MRTLTILGMVIAFGMVAALPFKRYQTIQDASTMDTNATGPIGPAQGNSDILIEDVPLGDINIPSLAVSPGKQWPPPLPNRRIQMPLTYEELSVPVQASMHDPERFDATVKAQEAIRAKRKPDLPPKVQPMQTTAEEASKLRVDSSAPKSILVSLAPSNSLAPPTGTSNVQRLPADSNVDRQRHWIRQP